MLALKTAEGDQCSDPMDIAQTLQAWAGNLARKTNTGIKDNMHQNSICSILRIDILSIEPSVLKDSFQVQN